MSNHRFAKATGVNIDALTPAEADEIDTLIFRRCADLPYGEAEQARLSELVRKSKGGATRQEVYEAIDGERCYQDRLSPTSETGGEHTVAEWALYIGDYARELQTVLSRTWGPKATEQGLDIIRKIAGMSVACMEQNGAKHRGVDLGKQPFSSSYTAAAKRQSRS